MRASRPSSCKFHVLALLLFSTAFGYLEAAVVSYLRYMHEPIRQRYYPGRPSADLFPLLNPRQVAAAGAQEHRILLTEIGREASTLIMLAAVALAISRSAGEWVAAFGIAFGIWDITFYLFLKVLLDWPASLLTWDVLFLIPVPWAGPVIAPVLVSAVMIAAGIWQLRRAATANPVRLGGWHWSSLVIGAAVIILSFTADASNILAGGLPRPFHWGIFGEGMGIGVLGFVTAAVNSTARQNRATAA
jgi:hypothetical protein